jgi:hypothetical protein
LKVAGEMVERSERQDSEPGLASCEGSGNAAERAVAAARNDQIGAVGDRGFGGLADFAAVKPFDRSPGD